MKDLGILFTIALCLTICSAAEVPKDDGDISVDNGSGAETKPGGSESDGSNQGPENGDDNNESGPGDNNEGEIESSTTTSKASSHSQEIAVLLSTLFIAYPTLY